MGYGAARAMMAVDDGGDLEEIANWADAAGLNPHLVFIRGVPPKWCSSIGS
jgi:hypothetical protein